LLTDLLVESDPERYRSSDDGELRQFRDVLGSAVLDQLRATVPNRVHEQTLPFLGCFI